MKIPMLKVLLPSFLIMSALACGKINKKKELPGPRDKIFEVSATEVQIREIADSTEFKGTFVSPHRIEFKSEFSGKIQAVSVVEGQTVAIGDALLKIDDEKLPYLLDRQRAELREAEAQLEIDARMASGNEANEEEPYEDRSREEDLAPQEPQAPEAGENWEENSEETSPPPGLSPPPSEEEREENSPFRRALLRNRIRRRLPSAQPTIPSTPREPAINPEVAENRLTLSQARVDRIKAEIALTEKQLSGSTLLAPFDAFVAKVGVAEGSTVQTNDFLLTLVSLDPVELSLEIPKEKIDQINKNLRFKVTVPDLNNETFSSDISFIGAEIDPVKKTVEVRLRVANPGFRIKVGMEGIAQLAVANRYHSALLIPPSAIVSRNHQQYVYVLRGQKAQLQEIQTGGMADGLIEVTRGLRKGEKIVSQGVSLLKEDEEFVQIRAQGF